jgi:hypothetical protein
VHKLRGGEAHVGHNKALIKVKLVLLWVLLPPVFEIGVSKDVADKYFMPCIIEEVPELIASRKLRS